MYLKLKQIVDHLLPGRVDGWVLLTTIAVCAIWTFSTVAELAFHPSNISMVEAVALAYLAIQCLIDLWVILSDQRMRYRFSVGMFVAAPTSLVSAIVANKLNPLGETTFSYLLALIFFQRLLVVSVALFVGVGIQSVSRWRIFLQAQPNDRPQRQEITILHIGLLTTLVAFGISIYRMLLIKDYEPFWGAYLALGIGELLLTVIFLLVPVLISFSARFLRRHFLVIQLTITAAIIGFVIFESSKGTGTPAISLAGLTTFFSILLAGTFFAKRWGYVLGHLRRDELWTTERSGVRARRIGWIVATALLAGTVAIQFTTSIPAFIYAMSRSSDEVTLSRCVQFSRAAKSIENITQTAGMSPGEFSSGGTLPTLRWTQEPTQRDDAFSIEAFLLWGNLEVNGCPNQLQILQAMSHLELPDVTITAPTIDRDVWDELSNHPKLAQLRLQYDKIDAEGFDSFCRQTKLTRLIVHSKPTIELLRSAKKMSNLRELWLQEHGYGDFENRCLPFPSEEIEELKGLPVQYCLVSYEDSSDIDFSEFDQIKGLQVASSSIDSRFVAKVNELASNGTLGSIDFLECNVDDAAVSVLSKMNVAYIFVYDRHMDPESVNWEPLLESKIITGLSICYGEDQTVESLKVGGKRK